MAEPILMQAAYPGLLLTADVVQQTDQVVRATWWHKRGLALLADSPLLTVVEPLAGRWGVPLTVIRLSDAERLEAVIIGGCAPARMEAGAWWRLYAEGERQRRR